MKNCQQWEHQSILEHGQAVCKEFEDLLSYIKSLKVSPSEDELYPRWIKTYGEQLQILLGAQEDKIKTYLLYHDCGKPLCHTVDEQGNSHFPNHAQISKETFLRYCNDTRIAHWIGSDMLCHTTRASEYQSLLGVPDIEILLCTALCALMANAAMFGGTQTQSFKIKSKNLQKLAERILAQKFGQEVRDFPLTQSSSF